MAIERTSPMAMHKNVVVRVLEQHPEDLADVSPNWTGTVEEFIKALRSDPHEWIIGGVLGDLPK